LAEVLRLFISVAHRLPMREVVQAEAVENRGFRGCAHGRPGSRRQVLLMDIETLERLGIPPGAVKENITTRGLPVQQLQPGQHLRAGQALLEVTVPCHPCARMNEIRPGLEEELRGRRGMLCRVVEGGTIACGDRIEIVDYARVAD
jgi:MOSC domain-containing protein YiiM